MDVRVKNGRIVDADRVYQGDVYIKDGKIAAIMTGDEVIAAAEEIDAKGNFIFPGGIDPHVHFNDPGYNWRETFSTGSKAAAAGGITTIVDMPLQNTPNLLNRNAYKNKAEAVKNASYIDYCFWGGFINDNIADFDGMADVGVKHFKAFMSSAGSDYPFVNNGIIKKAMEKLAGTKLMLGFHCEDYHIIAEEEKKITQAGKNTRRDFLDSRPLIAEFIATKNIIDMAGYTGAKVHICHVSHPEVAEEIRKAKHQGVKITAETCPHYLVFTEEDMLEKGTLLKCAPPLRNRQAREGLWQYVLDGTLDCIVSDHSPASSEEKLDDGGKKSIWDVWSGISGVQTGFQVIFNEVYHKRKLSPCYVAKMMSLGAAKAFDLYPAKGAVIPGADGDLAIVDPEKEWEIKGDKLLYTNKISGFEGLKGKGCVVTSILRGQVIYQNEIIVGKPGYGRLIQ